MHISPSLLAVWDKSNGSVQACVEAARQAQAAGADSLHIDIMDGAFVPATTFTHTMLTALKQGGVTLPLDVHLMVQNPEAVIPHYLSAGASSLTFHPTATQNINACLAMLQKAAVPHGFALAPTEPLTLLEPYAAKMSHVVLLTVTPGAGGQPFMEHLLPKITQAKAMLPQGCTLMVDGGINAHTAPKAAWAGATALVAGSAVFGASSIPHAIQSLRTS